MSAKLGIKFPISTGGGGGSVTENQYSAENKDPSALSPGHIVAVHSSGSGVVKARANSLGTRAVGMVIVGASSGASVTVQTDGIVTLADWTNAIGSVNLSANTVYFLNETTAGTMSQTAPSISGDHVQRIGSSVGATSLYLEIEQPILL